MLARALAIPLALLAILTVIGIVKWGISWALATYAGALIGTAIVVIPLLLIGRMR